MSIPRIHVRMRPRDTHEAHRASTPLELLFDLTFVAAISIASAGFAHQAEGEHPVIALGPFLFVFFSIWWAWMNFTWFASAYDANDVPYRLLTVLQMAGVLVLAAGVAQAYVTAQLDTGIITLGYVVMRLALVGQWVRASVAHPETRDVCVRYAVGVSLCQIGWVLRLLLPEPWMILTASCVLAVAELSVPVWAEHGRSIAWHAGHIAERYGLFVIILLGEGVLGATTAMRSAVEQSDAGLTPSLVAVGVLGLLVVVGLWWIYFLVPTEQGLERHRALGFFWGYGHFVLLAALALVGAGLEVAVAAVGHHGEPFVAVAAIAWPTAVVLLAIGVLHSPLFARAPIPWSFLAGAVLLTALAPLVAGSNVIVGVGATAAVLAALIAATTASRSRRELGA